MISLCASMQKFAKHSSFWDNSSKYISQCISSFLFCFLLTADIRYVCLSARESFTSKLRKFDVKFGPLFYSDLF